MLKRISRGYRVASSGAVLALICFFLPWMMTSCEPEPLTGAQLAVGHPLATVAKPRLFVLPAACVVVLVLAWRSARRRRLGAADGYVTTSAGTLALGVVAIQAILLVNEQGSHVIGFEPGLWGAMIGAAVIACGGAINMLDMHRDKAQQPRARSAGKDEEDPPGRNSEPARPPP